MERKLASIRKISDLSPIEGADKIEVATIDGWKVVVAKDVNHKVGDLVVYCEVDSFLPIREEFEFLRKSSHKKMGDQEGFRLKTIRLRGQLSQGLILPIHILPFGEAFHEGQDVTEVLGIVKYEPPVPAELAGKVKGLFPSFLRKTDEERVQNLTSEYEEYRTSDHKFYVTEKLDGSSATFYLRNGEFGVCSRNLELLETEGNTFWKVARELNLENKMKSLGKNISIQAELIGESVQGNPYKIKGQKFKDTVEMLGLETVPVLDTNFKLPDTNDELLKFADSKSELNPNYDREGIVIRTLDRKISFKVISNKFLLKYE